MALSIRMKFEPLRSLSFASVSGAYMGVGPALSHPASQIFVENLTDATIFFSFDGITNHFVLPANGFFLSDIGSNQARDLGFFLSSGERLYAKQEDTAPTSGNIYFSVVYGYET